MRQRSELEKKILEACCKLEEFTSETPFSKLDKLTLEKELSKLEKFYLELVSMLKKGREGTLYKFEMEAEILRFEHLLSSLRAERPHLAESIETPRATWPESVSSVRRVMRGEAERQRAIDQAESLLDLASRLLPRDKTEEAIGDCFERIRTDEAHHWLIQLDAIATIFWCVVFTLKDLGKPVAVFAAIWRILNW